MKENEFAYYLKGYFNGKESLGKTELEHISEELKKVENKNNFSNWLDGSLSFNNNKTMNIDNINTILNKIDELLKNNKKHNNKPEVLKPIRPPKPLQPGQVYKC